MKFPQYISWCPREEAKSFFLMKYKDQFQNKYKRYVRPCRKSYKDIVNGFKAHNCNFTLEGSCLDFTSAEYDAISDAEIILKTAIAGIDIDFIEYEDFYSTSNSKKKVIERIIDVRTNKIVWKAKTHSTKLN